MKFNTNDLEMACQALFNHEFWQVLNDTNRASVETYLIATNIKILAANAWVDDMPISYVIAQCTEQELYRAHIKRFIEAIYETLDTDFEIICYYDRK